MTDKEISISSMKLSPNDPLSLFNVATVDSQSVKSSSPPSVHHLESRQFVSDDDGFNMPSENLFLEQKPMLTTVHSSEANLTLPSEPASPILVFSKGSIKRSVSPESIDPSIVLKKTKLNFHPLNEGLFSRPANKSTDAAEGEKCIAEYRSNSQNQDPPTSPIEDPSLTSSFHLIDQVSEASTLFLEVKKRVAHHTTIKRRDKVVKLDLKPTKMGKVAAPLADKSSIIYVSSSPSTRASSPNLVPQDISVTEVNKSIAKTQTKVVMGKKAKPRLLTPMEYAQSLNEQITKGPFANAEKKYVRFLSGKHVFYTGGDMNYASKTTRGRMDLIVRHGGNLVPVYDPSVVTLVITDAQTRPTLRAMGLKHLRQIPDHIPTVAWPWMVSAISRAKVLDKNELEERMHSDLWIHAAFSDRIEAGPNLYYSSAQNDKIEEKHQRTDMSRISTQGMPAEAWATETVLTESDDKIGHSDQRLQWEDPLAEFYASARAERDDACLSSGEGENFSEGDEKDEKVVYGGPAPKRGWTCDNKEVQKTTVVNQNIINKLTELMELHEAKMGDEDRWRAFSYNKSIRALRNYPKRLNSYAEARNIRGVGERTARKIEEILETGELRRIRYERTDEVKSTRLFQGIYGVGRSTAFKWYAAGCRTLDDISAGKFGVSLSRAQEIGIRFYDDINDRMPRIEAKAIFDLIKPIALSIDPQLFFEIMGSYRRGKMDCGDIDVLLTRSTKDGKTHAGILPRLLKALRGAGIIVEDLALPEDSDGLEATYRGLCCLPDVKGSKYRRIDFLTVPWQSRGAALLYYTGDDIFNRAMRLKANALGYSLNQRGLFGNVIRDPHDRRIKMNAGKLVASETEEEIFDILGVPWQEPLERVRE